MKGNRPMHDLRYYQEIHMRHVLRKNPNKKHLRDYEIGRILNLPSRSVALPEKKLGILNFARNVPFRSEPGNFSGLSGSLFESSGSAINSFYCLVSLESIRQVLSYFDVSST